MGTTVGNKDIATTGSGHTAVTPPAMSLNPPTPPAGPVPVPYPYTARSATAKKTKKNLKAGGAPVLVKGSVMSLDPPANQPSQPTGGDVVTHGVKGKAAMTQGSSSTKAGGKPVCATGDMARMNLVADQQAVAQVTVPLLKAGGGDGAGGADGEGAAKDKKGKRALPAQKATKAAKTKGVCESDPVNVATGEVVDDAVDLSLPGPIPLVFRRSYASGQAKERGALGRGGWTHGFEQWVAEEEEVITLRDGEGRDVYFEKIQPGESAFHRRDRLTLTADRHGGFTIYDHQARLTRAFAPHERGRRAVLRAIRDGYGHAVTLDYEGEALARITDAAGREVRVRSDERGRFMRLEIWASGPPPLVDVAAPAPAPASEPTLQQWFDYTYHPEGELASAADALGHGERYEYDGLHRMVKKTLKNGVSFHYEYDEDSGWCVRAWGDGGLQRVELTPDLEKRTTLLSGSHEPKTYTWTADGLVVRQATHDGSVVRTRVYDDDHYLIAESNAAGETITYAYDARGNRVKSVDPAGNATIWEFEGDRPVKRIGPDGLVTTYTHDERGALLGVVYPSGAASTLVYDVDGRLTGIYAADGLLTGFVYDAHHNAVREVNARGARVHYVYDALGCPVSRTDALGRRTTIEYDVLRRPVGVELPDGTRTRTEYDALGNVVRFTDPLGRVTAMEYVGTGVLARMTQADGQAWAFAYDADERLRRIKNPRAELYELDYDAAGRLERERTFDGRSLEYRYSKAEQVIRIDYSDRTWRELSHDPLGNVIEERSPHGGVRFERDALGRIIKTVLEEYCGKTINVFERDALGRVIAERQGDRAIRYEHDDRGRRTARIMPGGETTRYYYDPLGALTALDHDGHKIAIERDVCGRETRKHVYRGRVDIQSAYDAMDRLADQRVTAPSPGGGAATVLARRKWSYDASGCVGQIEDDRWGSTLYTYDTIGQVVATARGPRREIFDYDVTGSLISALDDLDQGGRDGAAPWSALPGNVLTATADARYENDERGRRVKKITRGHGGSEEVTEYDWDCRDQLREVRLPTGERVRFTYDAFGRRVRKEVIPAERRDYAAMVERALEGGKDALPKIRVVEFLWDGDALAADLDSERGARVFVHHPGTVVPMLQQEQGATFTYVNDHLGMPKELVDQDGRIAWAASHATWGAVTGTFRDPKARIAVDSPFRLLGQYADDETGLAYTRFRYFDPKVARWCSPDPAGMLGGSNAFAFDGSPTMAVDPLGLTCNPGRVKHLLSALLRNGSANLRNGLHKDTLAALSQALNANRMRRGLSPDQEIGVVQDRQTGALRVIIGTGDGRRVICGPNEVFVAHSHPVQFSQRDHFQTDTRNAPEGGRVEVVVDEGGNVTHFSRGTHYEFDDRPPPESPINEQGHIVGYPI